MPSGNEPRALADVLALAEGSSRDFEGVLAPDMEAWLASPEQGLAAAIESVGGAQATAGALADLAPSSVTVCATVVSDRACWAEISREDETGVVGLTFGAAGLVSRLVFLRVPSAPPADVDPGASAPDGRPVLERYLADLMNSRFTEAASRFTTDTIYSHPPYGGGTERVVYRGREALARGFATDRGPSPVRQIITDLWQQDGRAFVEGVVEGIPNGGTFVSTAQISDGGEIARYVAFYSATRIPRAP